MPELEQSDRAAFGSLSAARQIPASNKTEAARSHRILTTIECSPIAVLQQK
jgi:hypothetical protein